MKRLIILLAVLSIFKDIGSNASVIEDLISSMRNSFNTLNSKRDLWFNNYSQLKKLSDDDKSRLSELLTVSKLAVPLVWQLYKSEVSAQKQNAFKLVKEGNTASDLPYQVFFPAPFPQRFHVEVTFLSSGPGNFQLEILQDETRKIMGAKIDMIERRLILTDQNEEGEEVDRVILDGDSFPALQPSKPFRINIQVADDCIFTSFWVGDLSLGTPMQLPEKHYWCTKIYSLGTSFKINILDAQVLEPDDEHEHDAGYAVKVLETIVYKGIIVQ